MRERKRDKGRLEDILNCIDNVQQYIKGVTFNDFVSDSMRYFAVMKNVEIIGEAANMLTRNFRKNDYTCLIYQKPPKGKRFRGLLFI
ncbi:MAG: DUF86 domain-containing protein [Prevotella sp.]|nr:DUF86 domain-containing protein [Prevotella sp.]